MSKLIFVDGKIFVLENLANQKTPLHNLHPLIKVLLTFLLIIMVISSPLYDVSRLIPFVCYLFVLLLIGEIPFQLILSRLWLVLPFPLLCGFSNVFFKREIAFALGAISVSFGVISLLVIILKTLLTVSAVFILIATTGLNDLCASLRTLKVPGIFITVLIMIYRYLTVLLEEAGSMYNAYLLRTQSNKLVMKDMGSFLGNLLLRSFSRAERVYFAMQCRGFNHHCFVGIQQKVRFQEIILALAVAALLLLLRFFNLSVIIGNLVV